MADYSNDQSYYGSSHTGSRRYVISGAGQQQDGNRRSSFSTGDEGTLQGQAQQYMPHATYNADANTQLPYPTRGGATNPYGYPSQSHVGGYTHQPQPATYNPSSYTSMPNSVHYGSTYQSPTANAYPQPAYTPYTTSAPSIPAYNPAAYSTPPVNSAASLQNQNYGPVSSPLYITSASAHDERSQILYSHPQLYSAGYPTQHQSQVPTLSAATSPPIPPPHTSSSPYTNTTSYIDPYATQTSAYPSPPWDHRRPSSHHEGGTHSYTTPYDSAVADLRDQRTSQAFSPSLSPFRHHPQGRTLPGIPSSSESDSDTNGGFATNGMDGLMNTIDAAISSSSATRDYDVDDNDPLFRPSRRDRSANGFAQAPLTTDASLSLSDSDPEAAAGLVALQAADAAEALEIERRASGQIAAHTRIPGLEQSSGSEMEGEIVDMSALSGGFAGQMHYGDYGSPSYPASIEFNYPSASRLSSVRSSVMSSNGRVSIRSAQNHLSRMPSESVRVDAGATGGLNEPSAHSRRLSYEDGDETPYIDDYANEAQDGIPDMFFHPGMSPNRPLPPPPVSEVQSHNNRSTQQQLLLLQSYPNAPDSFRNEYLGLAPVPRSTSLANARSQPRAEQPIRSKTDADRAKFLKQQQQQQQQQQQASRFSDPYTPTSTSTDMGTLDLPTIPRKKFDPAKLSSESFRRCHEPWAVSSVLDWIRTLTAEESDLKEAALCEAVTALFMSKVPTMPTLEAESLGQKFVADMLRAGVLIKDEEWVKFMQGSMSGVLFQLTGLGCYSSRVHAQPSNTKGKCYAQLCMRTSRKLDLEQPTSQDALSWVEFYQVKKDDIENKDRKEVERQNNLHEVVTSEEKFMFDLDVTRHVYRDRIKSADPPLVAEKRLASFLKEVFGLIDKVKITNEEHLLKQLKYRQQEQGPWVVGYSDILREWIRKARPVFVEFASAYPRADAAMRTEQKTNPQFRVFLENARHAEGSRKLGWDHYLKAPITRMQRYPLLLQQIYKNSVQDNDEKTNLAYAIDEIKAAVHEADSKFAEYDKKIELETLMKKVRLRKYMQGDVDLALNHLGRVMIMRGDLQRQGEKGVAWVTSHTILFDHFLILTKVSTTVYGEEIYDVSRAPIPMDLLVLESTNDQPVVRSSLRGVTAVPRMTVNDPRTTRGTVQTSAGGLAHTNTGITSASTSTTGTSNPVTTVIDQDLKEDKILYPFKVRHLGRSEVYTLYAPSVEKRAEWCEAIISAKTAHAESLHAQNAEPFKLRVLADTAFATDVFALQPRRVVIKGTPLDRAIREVEQRYANTGRSGPLSRLPINCATVFQQPHGRFMCAVGSDQGVFVSEYDNPRGWFKSIAMPVVTQIAVLEEFNLLIILSNRVLIAYHLDVVCPPTGPPVPQTDPSIRKAPQKLSGSKDVGFFVTAKLKDRALVFYQKRDGINSIFKILEPVLQKNATSKSRWLNASRVRGQTEFFREYDEFYVPTETYSLNVFHSSLAVATRKGMQVITLDKKSAWDVPNLEADSRETQTHLASIATRIKDLKPLGMFRLSDAEFLVTYAECAVYINKQGDVSRSVIMDFVGRAHAACLYYAYLILFNDDFVEIRDAQNGRLKQVITGRGITILDDGGAAQPGAGHHHTTFGGGGGMNGSSTLMTSPRTVKVGMQHPEHDRLYVIVELLLVDERH